MMNAMSLLDFSIKTVQVITPATTGSFMRTRNCTNPAWNGQTSESIKIYSTKSSSNAGNAQKFPVLNDECDDFAGLSSRTLPGITLQRADGLESRTRELSSSIKAIQVTPAVEDPELYSIREPCLEQHEIRVY